MARGRNPLAESLGLPNERGRIVVQPDLAVAGSKNIWAIGDCALVANAHDGKNAPPTAQFAVQRRGVPRQQHQPPRRGARHGSVPLPIARHDGVDRPYEGRRQYFRRQLSGLPAWLLWRAYYLSQMPTFGRKLRIFVEWTWGMFFPADITHLRFTRSGEVDR